MPYDIRQFIKQVLTSNDANLSPYDDPIFCKKMKLYALEKIKYLLLDILRSHLPHEHVGSNDPFYLSSYINTVDREGLNLVDYCALAGFDEMGCLYAKLGGVNSIDLNRIQQKLIDKDSLQLEHSEMIDNILETKVKIEEAISEYKNSPINTRPMIGGGPNPTIWQKIKHVVVNFPYNHHKFSIFILLFGISCLIAAPFTAGLSTILLLTLGFPAMLTGISTLQNAVTTLNSYQQVEENGRIMHEAEMVRIMHKDVCHQIKTLSAAEQNKPPISMHVNSKHIQNNHVKATTVMYSKIANKKHKHDSTKDRKPKLNLSTNEMV